MGRVKGFSFKAFAALLLSASFAASADAAGPSPNGRDFSAQFDFKNVSAVDTTHVAVTVVLRVVNHSGAEVSGAQLSLQNSVLHAQSIGAFPQIVQAVDG